MSLAAMAGSQRAACLAGPQPSLADGSCGDGKSFVKESLLIYSDTSLWWDGSVGRSAWVQT